jgi:hypothetical protein
VNVRWPSRPLSSLQFLPSYFEMGMQGGNDSTLGTWELGGAPKALTSSMLCIALRCVLLAVGHERVVRACMLLILYEITRDTWGTWEI